VPSLLIWPKKGSAVAGFESTPSLEHVLRWSSVLSSP
jgi:hypothetical protein